MCRVLALFLPLFLLGCSSGGGTLVPASQMVGPAGGQVVSADGHLTLTIPAGALGADTPITIRAVSPSALGPDFQGVDVAAAYELGPDGLVFGQPVAVSLRLDQSPTGPGGVLQVDPVALLTESGGTVEALDAQVLTADADAGTAILTAELTHFSPLVGATIFGRVEVSGVPDVMPAQETFDVTFNVLAYTAFPADRAKRLVDLKGWGDPVLAPGQDTPFVEAKLDAADSPFGMGPFRCTSPGNGTFHAQVFFPITIGQALYTPGNQLRLELHKQVVHGEAPPQARAFPVTMAELEGMHLLDAPSFPSLVKSTGQSHLAQATEPSLVTVAGRDAWEIVDTDTGDELASVATPAGATYGAVPLADGGVPAVFAFGAWGASVWPWENGAFGAPVPVSTHNITDAYPCASGGLAFVDNTDGKVFFLELAGGAYQVAATVMDLAGAVSAQQLPDGSILALADGDPGALYAAADRQAAFAPVGQVGTAPRRVRALGDVAAISEYGSGIGFGAITIASRNGGAWAIGFALVGPSSVGIDLKELGNGHVLVGATSYKSNEYRVIEVEADGTYVTDQIASLPAGCDGPGHAVWLAGTANQLAVSCHDSGVLAVIPVTTE